MTVNAFAYPVPFTQLLIYPDHIVSRHNPRQILHREETASFGTLFRERVFLDYTENTHPRLVCEKLERDEHGPGGDLECSISATLALVPQPCFQIPLTKWILSLPWKNLGKYTDYVCVETDCGPISHQFKRYRQIKSSQMKNSHYQPGWNCTHDEIGLGFDSPNVWHLCRESHWLEAPTGLPYTVTIQMRLRPGVEQESEEALCSLLNQLPWWSPNSADRLMWDARNWLDTEWLHRQAEFNDTMHAKHPHNDAYGKALDEILRQLCIMGE